jgi:hypothetical protein
VEQCQPWRRESWRMTIFTVMASMLLLVWSPLPSPVEFASLPRLSSKHATFADMGEQNLKNIARMARVYRVRLTPEGPKASPALALPDRPSACCHL